MDMRQMLVLLFSLASAVSTQAIQCIQCSDAICFQKNQASITSPTTGECIFAAEVKQKDIFWTGHVFGLGVCPAVQLSIGKKCFRDMAGSIAVQLGKNVTMYDRTAVCKIAPYDTPCSYAARKFEFETEGYNCAEIKILADNVVEECIRNDADGRFWATLAYWFAVLLVPLFFAFVCGCMAAH